MSIITLPSFFMYFQNHVLLLSRFWYSQLQKIMLVSQKLYEKRDSVTMRNYVETFRTNIDHKRLQRGCFSANTAKFLRTTFLRKTGTCLRFVQIVTVKWDGFRDLQTKGDPEMLFFFICLFHSFKGTAMQIEKALINNSLRVSKVS